MDDHKETCCNCGKSGGSTFATVYPIRIKKGPWKWLCSICWDGESKKT